ncbi:MAG: hypothetical protein DRN14_05710, partial [Thermoplasmata archaeon]
MVDRAARRIGWRTPLTEGLRRRVARPKGTSEVRPQGLCPSEDSPYHGGDGASGEVLTPVPMPG